MNVGELFLNIGIKGGDVVGKVLDQSEKGMSGLAFTAGEAKLAIAGIATAVEETFRQSGKAGHTLEVLADAVGVSTDKIQGLQNAFRNIGGDQAADQVGDLLQNLQKVQTQIGTGSTLNAWQEKFFASSPANREKFVHDKIYALEQVRQWLQKQDLSTDSARGRAENIVNSLVGGGAEVFHTLLRMKQDITSLKPGNIVADTRGLDKLNSGFANILRNIKVFGENQSAAFGPEFIANLSQITNSVIKLTAALIKAGNAIGFFKGIGSLIQTASTIINETSNGVNSWFGSDKDKAKLQQDLEKDPRYQEALKDRQKFLAMASGPQFAFNPQGFAGIAPKLNDQSGGNNTVNVSVTGVPIKNEAHAANLIKKEVEKHHAKVIHHAVSARKTGLVQ